MDVFVIETENQNVQLRPIDDVGRELNIVSGNPNVLFFGVYSDESRVGHVTLWPSQEEGMVDLGYEIRGIHQGKGYATLAAKAITAYAEDELGMNAVKAKIEERNVASQKVALKAGYVAAGKEGDFLVFKHQPEVKK